MSLSLAICGGAAVAPSPPGTQEIDNPATGRSTLSLPVLQHPMADGGRLPAHNLEN